MAIWKIPAAAEQRRARSDRAEGERCTTEGDARRHSRRCQWRGTRRHEPGRAARARAESVLPAGDDGREPVPLRRGRRPGAVDGSGEGRRARSGARGRREDAPGRRLHARRSPARGRPTARDRRQDPRGVTAQGLGGRAREALTPVERHIQDARSLVRTAISHRRLLRASSLVLPTRDRGGCVEATRRRRSGEGNRTRRSRRRFGRCTRLTGYAALALFDDRAVVATFDKDQRGIRSWPRPTRSRRRTRDLMVGSPGSRHSRSRVGHPRTRHRGGEVTRRILWSRQGRDAAGQPALVGVRPRAAALLARQAVEDAMARVLSVRAPGAEHCANRPRLLCLREYVPENSGSAPRSFGQRSRALVITIPTS